MPNTSGKTSLEDKYANEILMRNSAITALRPMTVGRDVLIIGDLDEIISHEAFMQFDPDIQEWMGAQQRYFQFYLNRLLVFDTPERKQLINYWTHGTKIITVEAIKKRLNFDLNLMRYDWVCGNQHLKSWASFDGDYDIECRDKYIAMAGWHFSYIMDDQHLLKKMRQNADFDKNYTISDFEQFRK